MNNAEHMPASLTTTTYYAFTFPIHNTYKFQNKDLDIPAYALAKVYYFLYLFHVVISHGAWFLITI